MPLQVRFQDDQAILSNIGRMMNDPRYGDARREVRELLDGGCRRFIIEVRDVRDTGSSLLGVLVSLTRQVREQGGEVVLAHPSRALTKYLDEMQMEDYWDIFDSVDDAIASAH
jgi:anti-anti-sigma factor